MVDRLSPDDPSKCHGLWPEDSQRLDDHWVLACVGLRWLYYLVIFIFAIAQFINFINEFIVCKVMATCIQSVYTNMHT